MSLPTTKDGVTLYLILCNLSLAKNDIQNCDQNSEILLVPVLNRSEDAKISINQLSSPCTYYQHSILSNVLFIAISNFSRNSIQNSTGIIKF